jgi:hypothetical protein
MYSILKALERSVTIFLILLQILWLSSFVKYHDGARVHTPLNNNDNYMYSCFNVQESVLCFAANLLSLRILPPLRQMLLNILFASIPSLAAQVNHLPHLPAFLVCAFHSYRTF